MTHPCLGITRRSMFATAFCGLISGNEVRGENFRAVINSITPNAILCTSFHFTGDLKVELYSGAMTRIDVQYFEVVPGSMFAVKFEEDLKPAYLLFQPLGEVGERAMVKV